MISMLPGGSITGCPKKRAMEIIDELEPTTRSVYTGVIGYIEPNQNMEFSIAIRTIIKKKEKLYLQVGGGIVVDSKNKSEYEETIQKAKSFMKIS
jgi:para-aminobenzoate synthetase component 1